ncbi:PREDICTED: cytosolic carboxypeptidase 2-like [Eufriesea mexicana]|uniref:cytosolic carboxypeptidase 2-like n=1 Tax=Eufriesea mexicana TaxID=516756 RepID=UPI00083BF6B8|nr:PREDICTED: cytosolic carboxypeptidase 2-like [Eufriesea mexicana]
MRDLSTGSKVKELQAMLFPVQPIPGSTLANLNKLQELQLLQLGQCEVPRRETELSLFSMPFGTKDDQSQETLRSLLDTRCMIDGITQEAARWPTECQVLPERVRHIEYAPDVPEPFYVPTGKEPRPKPLGDEYGTVIFRYHPISITSYFSRSCVGGNTVAPFPPEFSTDLERDESKDDDTARDVLLITRMSDVIDTNTDLHFESRFESGNLCKVVKITDTYYQLYLRKDLYTQRHTQWYYFRISNTRSRTNYRISIVNLCKEESLYNEGLRPLLYSTEDAKKRAVGWRRCGENIAYYRNDSSSDEEKEKHTLTFNISFPHDRDTVYLAHCYPYTYTDLQEYLAKLVADPVKSRYTKLRLLCRTLAGNGVYYLTITAPTYDEEARRKRGIVVTARVHPGETPSSWTMKGIIDFLTGESNQARVLRERFVFKLIPMLNPDGVIVGNNRCSLSGKDLNRQYRTVMRESYPSVWHTKLMIRRLLEECGVAIYCDLHAHSRKHNIFVYGCENKRTASQTRLSEQVFPLMLHKNAADKFSFENCKFHMEKGKEGTGRVVIWSMGVQNSYTMEASMGGTKIGSRSGTHFSTQDYEQIGKVFCETLLDFFDPDPVKERLRNKIIARLMKGGSSAEEPTNIDLTDYSSDEGDTSESSISGKEEIEFTEGAWTYTVREPIVSPQYLCAPPPTPTFVPLRSLELAKRRSKKDTTANRSYLRRRRMLTRRAVMDLPTTDPGSDLCDYIDSADEGLTRPERSSARIREHDKKEPIQFMEKETEEISNNDLVLPEIVRPRSMSLGENFSVNVEAPKANKRSHCLRLVRTLRHRSPIPLKSRDLQIKLSSLRQQIWMGMPLNVAENIEKSIEHPLVKGPLSWGISNMALTQNKMDSDEILKGCTKKLQFLEYIGTEDKIKEIQNKYKCVNMTHSKGTGLGMENQRQDPERKSRKKEPSLKWQKIMNSRVEEMCHGKTSFLTIDADSLKLVTLEVPSKVQTRQHKVESRRKHRKSGATCSISNGGKASSVTKSQRHLQTHSRSHIQLQPLIVPLCDSFSSDNDSTDSRTQRVSKKKYKKKKQAKKIKSTLTAGRKKRTTSANVLRNS